MENTDFEFSDDDFDDVEDFSHMSTEDEFDELGLVEAMLKPNTRVISELKTEDEEEAGTLAIIDDTLTVMQIFDKLSQINQLVDHSIIAELMRLGRSVVNIRMKGARGMSSADPDDLQSIWDKAVRTRKTKNYVGTGWVFGSTRKVLMTNNHVIPIKDIAETAFIHFDFKKDFRTGKRTSQKVMKLAPEKLFFTSPVMAHEGLDYTVVALEEAAPEEYGFLEYDGNATAEDATHVFVPQPPRGRTKTYVFHNNFKVNESQDYLTYTSDTEGGSSGSPLFDDKLNLIGIHHIGNYSATREGRRMLTNLGSRIEVVIADLADKLLMEGWTAEQVEEWFGNGSVLQKFNE